MSSSTSSSTCCKTTKTLLIAAGALAAAGLVCKLFFCKSCPGSSKKSTTTTAPTTTKKKIDAIVISGPSGVGKGTLINKLRAAYPSQFGFSVSHTTRAPRAGEVDGKDYHFTTRDQMLAAIERGEFLESCDVHGSIYGTSKAALQAVRDEGKIAIIEMDVQGAKKLKLQQGNLHFHYLFVTAPLEELEKRIVKRGADGPEKVQIRLATARSEFAFLQENPTFFNTVMQNDDLEASYAKLVNLLRSEGASI